MNPANQHLNRIRFLTISLFTSGALNIMLIAFLFFWTLHERPPTPYFELQPKAQKTKMRTLIVSPTNANLLSQYKALPYEQLLLKLNRTGLVEDGFTERDLSLGVLVAFHEFNIEKALSQQPHPAQKRLLSFNDGQEKVIVFPGLTEAQFEAITEFARTERWPFKSRGLYLLLKKEPTQADTTLQDTFYLTQEFAAMEGLFREKGIERAQLLQMIVEGDWGTLSALNEKQKASQDLSDDNRQRVLLNYLRLGSKTAADILLKTDFDFVSKRLSDATVLSIVRALEQNTPEATKFLAAAAASPRSDQVRTLAIARYKELTGKSWEPLVSRVPVAAPKPLAIQKAMPFKAQVKTAAPKKLSNKPIAEAPKPAPPKPAKKPKDLNYVVQDGDTLWKIAKRFKVSVDEIKTLNKLTSPSLKTGTPLKIPAKTSTK